MEKYVGQKSRAILFIVKFLLLFGINFWAFGTIIPNADGTGLWFYSALISVLLANNLVTPYYSKPVDAISYSVVSGIALYLVSDYGNWNIFEQSVFWITLAYFSAVLFISFAQIFTKDSSQEWV